MVRNKGYKAQDIRLVI